MITYKRYKMNDTRFGYLRNGSTYGEKRIPQEVMEKFQYVDTIEYDDAPNRRRCIFCDAPQSRQRYLDGTLHDLCEWHYQHARLGEIAQQIRLNVELAKTRQSKLDAKEQARKDLWHKQHPKAGKKRKRKTALSKVISGEN